MIGASTRNTEINNIAPESSKLQSRDGTISAYAFAEYSFIEFKKGDYNYSLFFDSKSLWARKNSADGSSEITKQIITLE